MHFILDKLSTAIHFAPTNEVHICPLWLEKRANVIKIVESNNNRMRDTVMKSRFRLENFKNSDFNSGSNFLSKLLGIIETTFAIWMLHCTQMSVSLNRIVVQIYNILSKHKNNNTNIICIQQLNILHQDLKSAWKAIYSDSLMTTHKRTCDIECVDPYFS